MDVSQFQKTVLAYSHLPGVFLSELARVADRIPEEKQEEILRVLDKSAKLEIEILAKGYKEISDAEKKMRKQVEASDKQKDLQTANSLLQ